MLRLGHGVREGTTDADGLARVEGMRPGRATAWSPYGGRRTLVDVLAGEEVEAVITLKNTTRIEGRVVDPAGEAVPHADVWLLIWGARLAQLPALSAQRRGRPLHAAARDAPCGAGRDR